MACECRLEAGTEEGSKKKKRKPEDEEVLAGLQLGERPVGQAIPFTPLQGLWGASPSLEGHMCAMTPGVLVRPLIWFYAFNRCCKT